jgi:hypothetical protein
MHSSLPTSFLKYSCSQSFTLESEWDFNYFLLIVCWRGMKKETWGTLDALPKSYKTAEKGSWAGAGRQTCCFASCKSKPCSLLASLLLSQALEPVGEKLGLEPLVSRICLS